MGSSADADDVLPRRPPEAHDHVPALALDQTRRQEGEAHEATPAVPGDHRNAMHVDPRPQRLGSCREDVQVMSPRGQPLGHATEIGLGAAAGEAPMHERDAHPAALSSAGAAGARGSPGDNGD